MKRNLPWIVGFLLLTSFGVAEGMWTGRWKQTDESLDKAVARIAAIPQSLGDWQGDDKEIDAQQIKIARIKGYALRKYVQHKTGESVEVILLCGRPGPISVHTPDLCFQASGMKMKDAQEREKFDIPGLVAPFQCWCSRFEMAGPNNPSFTVLWSWSTDGNWIAPVSPRVQFGRADSLYKMYVIHQIDKLDTKPAQDKVVNDFLRTFLPSVQAALFSQPRS